MFNYAVSLTFSSALTILRYLRTRADERTGLQGFCPPPLSQRVMPQEERAIHDGGGGGGPLRNIASAYLRPDRFSGGKCGGRKVVAFAITLTKEGDHLDGAVVLAASIGESLGRDCLCVVLVVPTLFPLWWRRGSEREQEGFLRFILTAHVGTQLTPHHDEGKHPPCLVVSIGKRVVVISHDQVLRFSIF